MTDHQVARSGSSSRRGDSPRRSTSVLDSSGFPATAPLDSPRTSTTYFPEPHSSAKHKPSSSQLTQRTATAQELRVYAEEVARRKKFQTVVARLKTASRQGSAKDFGDAYHDAEEEHIAACPNLYYVNALEWSIRMYCSARATIRGLGQASFKYCNSAVLQLAIEDAEDDGNRRGQALMLASSVPGRPDSPNIVIDGRQLTITLDSSKKRLRVIGKVEALIARALTTLRVSDLQKAYEEAEKHECGMITGCSTVRHLVLMRNRKAPYRLQLWNAMSRRDVDTALDAVLALREDIFATSRQQTTLFRSDKS